MHSMCKMLTTTLQQITSMYENYAMKKGLPLDGHTSKVNPRQYGSLATSRMFGSQFDQSQVVFH
jgi:hypothetical protein